MKIVIVVLAVVLGLTACAQRGTRFDVDKVSELQPGISTDQDAIAKLGPPMAVSNAASGNKLLQWQYVYGTALATGGGAHVAILFGQDGKMIRVTHLAKV
jgi:hypothetical protein